MKNLEIIDEIIDLGKVLLAYKIGIINQALYIIGKTSEDTPIEQISMNLFSQLDRLGINSLQVQQDILPESDDFDRHLKYTNGKYIQTISNEIFCKFSKFEENLFFFLENINKYYLAFEKQDEVKVKEAEAIIYPIGESLDIPDEILKNILKTPSEIWGELKKYFRKKLNKKKPMIIKNKDEIAKIDKLWSYFIKASKTNSRYVPRIIVEKLGIKKAEYNMYMEYFIEEELIKGEENIDDFYEFTRFTHKGEYFIEMKKTFKKLFESENDINISYKTGDGSINQRAEKIVNKGPIFIGSNNTHTINKGQTVISGDNNIISISREEISSLKEFLDFYNENEKNLDLKIEDKDDIQNEIKRINTQIKRASPKKAIISSALNSIHGILTGVAANAWTQTLLTNLQQLISMF